LIDTDILKKKILKNTDFNNGFKQKSTIFIDKFIVLGLSALIYLENLQLT